MKKKIIVLIIAFIGYGYTTTSTQDPFLGTWEWHQGNQIFRVEFYNIQNDIIDGNYTMLTVNTQGEETIIYKSNKNLGQGYTYGSAIFGGSNGVDTLGALIVDNITPNPGNYPALEGSLTMKIITTANCVDCQTKATWKVKEKKESRFEGDNRTLSIPTDIVLTKVQ